jgi:hypothetical protein
VQVPLSLETSPLKTSARERVLKGEIYSSAEVNDAGSDNKRTQSLHFSLAGMHKKTCPPVLAKISRYETYKNHLDFIKESTYDDIRERIRFKLSSSLLPFDMLLDFKLPRITSPGSYPFSFDNGFLAGLKGDIHVSEEKRGCFFYVSANWNGPHSSIPNTIFEFFTQTLTKIAMTNLFRLANSY